MDNINLIRKIAWSFHRTTGIDWDELFQEAALAYLTLQDKYDPDRGEFSTYIWKSLVTHLQTYLQNHEKKNGPICYLEDIELDENPMPVESLFDSFSRDAAEIAELVLGSPVDFDGMIRKNAKRKVIKQLREHKWTFRRIWQGLIDLRIALD